MPTSRSDQRPVNAEDSLSFGTLTINLGGFSVSVRGKDVRITHAEFLLLVALARHPYSVIDRPTLVKVLKDGNVGRKWMETRERAVDTHIARIRRKLDRAGCDCIGTMRGVGYRFVPPDGNDSTQGGA